MIENNPNKSALAYMIIFDKIKESINKPDAFEIETWKR
jgi:hypothetical protein